MSITVQSCHIYPLKSGAGLSLREMWLEAQGPAGDRRFMLVNAETGKFISQRSHPRMALISATPTDEGFMKFEAPGQAPLWVARDEMERTRETTVWNDTGSTYFADDGINRWFSAYIGSDVQLVKQHPQTIRPMKPGIAAPGDCVSFADAYPLLITSTGSLRALRPYFDYAVGMPSFRPNIVIDADPFEEDTMARIRIGEAEIEIATPCSRCPVTSIDQDTGEKPSKDPLETLMRLRKGADNHPYFGANAIPRVLAPIRIGDKVEILETRPLPEVLRTTELYAGSFPPSWRP